MKYILQPRFAEKFKCIASACEDSCCAGWNIGIEENQIQYYSEHIDKMGIHTITCEAGSKKCRFWSEDKLCNVQKCLGEEELPDTCFFFPRSYNFLDDTIELTLDLACPHVAELALADSSAMDMVQVQLDKKMEHRFKIVSNAVELCKVEKMDPFFNQIREFIFSLIKNRKYNIEERLMILGRFCSDLDYYKEQKQWNQTIDKLIADYTETIKNDGFREYLEIVPSRTEMILPVIIELLEKKVETGILSYELMQLIQNMKNQYEFGEKKDFKRACDFFSNNKAEFYNEFANQNEFVLENYFLNILRKELFPFGRKQNMKEDDSKQGAFQMYYRLILLFALLKFFLIIDFSEKNTHSSLRKSIHIIQLFMKHIGHDNSFMDGVFKFFQDNDAVERTFANLLIRY